MRRIVTLLVLGAVATPLAAQRASSHPTPERITDAAPAPWLRQDPADSLYQLARNALNRGDYREAVTQFRQLRDSFPRSGYAGDAHYWEAFALHRLGSASNLKDAVALLDRQAARYPESRTVREARELRVRIRGQLAQLGDAAAAEDIAGIAAETSRSVAETDRAAAETSRAAAEISRASDEAARGVARQRSSRRSGECDDQDDERLAALNALLQMRSEQALPILRQVLERRDEGSICLRRKAVFLVSQKRSAETAAILLNSVRSDPDGEVREQAVFWLSQVNTPQATAALDSILQNAADHQLQEKAIFALSQQRSDAAGRALRDHLERPATPDDLKENVIFWLGQRRSEENGRYLREYYGRTSNPELKEKVIFSLSQMGLEENARWLMSIAVDETQPIEVRKNALFWAGQMRQVNVDDLAALYDRVQHRDIKEHLIFVYSQRRETAAVDKLMDIVRNETDRELRGKAIFWLGQSRDPRVGPFLLEIINK